MQRKSLGKHMWEILNPLFVRYAIAYIVEFVIIMAYGMYYFEGFMGSIETEEQVYEHVMRITEQLLPYSIQMGGLSALLTIPFLAVMMKRDRIKEKAINFVSNNVAPIKSYIFAGIMSIAVAVGLNNILLLVNIAEYSPEYQETMAILYSPSLPVQVLCLGILYPIMEELIFRGLIFRRMRINVLPIYSILLSAVLFGVYHGNSVQMIYGFLCGIMLAYFYEKYGSIKAPIFGHILMNIVSVLITYVDGFTWMFAKPIRMAVITVICAAVASSMFVLIRAIEEKPQVKTETE